jgi:hypothetical protein
VQQAGQDQVKVMLRLTLLDQHLAVVRADERSEGCEEGPVGLVHLGQEADRREFWERR